MIIKPSVALRIVVLISLMVSLTLLSSGLRADTGTCNGATLTLPFTDVAGSSLFCQIASAYFSGLTNGTTATTYSPGNVVNREQMAAFVTRTMDQSLKRGSNRAALDQFWTIQGGNNLELTTVGSNPRMVESDGTDLWVANNSSDTVSRVRASDGRVLETWTGANGAFGVLVARGKIFITGPNNPSFLYQIDPTQPAGAVTTLTDLAGVFPIGIAYDGHRIWTANINIPSISTGSVSIVTLNPTSVINVAAGLIDPRGLVYDGTNMWVTDAGDDSLKKLDASGAVLITIPMGNNADPQFPVFDGINIWVPNLSTNNVKVVRVKDSAGIPVLIPSVIQTLTNNGLNAPQTVTFDGERILVTNFDGDSVSLWKASDLTPIGKFSIGADTNPFGACSDGLNFWITLNPAGTADKLARF